MGRREEAAFVPDPHAADAYDELYAEYRLLHDHFGRGGNDVMHRLRALRRRAAGDSAASAGEPVLETTGAAGGSA
jgi:L-ribulokinase